MYGEGIHYGMAIISMKWPFLMSLVCCFVGAAPRLLIVVFLGLVSATVAFGAGILTETWIGERFSGVATLHVPAAAATSLVLVSYFVYGHCRTRAS